MYTWRGPYRRPPRSPCVSGLFTAPEHPPVAANASDPSVTRIAPENATGPHAAQAFAPLGAFDGRFPFAGGSSGAGRTDGGRGLPPRSSNESAEIGISSSLKRPASDSSPGGWAAAGAVPWGSGARSLTRAEEGMRDGRKPPRHGAHLRTSGLRLRGFRLRGLRLRCRVRGYGRARRSERPAASGLAAVARTSVPSSAPRRAAVRPGSTVSIGARARALPRAASSECGDCRGRRGRSGRSWDRGAAAGGGRCGRRHGSGIRGLALRFFLEPDLRRNGVEHGDEHVVWGLRHDLVPPERRHDAARRAVGRQVNRPQPLGRVGLREPLGEEIRPARSAVLARDRMWRNHSASEEAELRGPTRAPFRIEYFPSLPPRQNVHQSGRSIHRVNTSGAIDASNIAASTSPATSASCTTARTFSSESRSADFCPRTPQEVSIGPRTSCGKKWKRRSVEAPPPCGGRSARPAPAPCVRAPHSCDGSSRARGRTSGRGCSDRFELCSPMHLVVAAPQGRVVLREYIRGRGREEDIGAARRLEPGGSWCTRLRNSALYPPSSVPRPCSPSRSTAAYEDVPL